MEEILPAARLLERATGANTNRDYGAAKAAFLQGLHDSGRAIQVCVWGGVKCDGGIWGGDVLGVGCV